MKLDLSFYKNTLLPGLYRAKEAGVDITSKSKLLAHFTTGAEKTWVCLVTAQDLDDVNEIVTAMKDEKHDVLASLSIADTEERKSNYQLLKICANLKNNELSDKLYSTIVARKEHEIDQLNKLLWKSGLHVVEPEQATDDSVKKLSKEALDFLNTKSKEDEIIKQEAIMDFLDQIYFTDPDFKGNKKIKVFAADFYYKGRGDELDDLEINSDVTENEINLGVREILKHY